MNLRAALAIDEAHRRGVVLTVDPPATIRFKAPPGAMTPDLVEDLKAHKPAVIRLLGLIRSQSTPARPVEPSPPPAPLAARPRPRTRQADPHTLRLIAWYRETVQTLPREPFHLAAGLHVTDPAKFFDRLRAEADRYPNGDRPAGLGSDLVLLKAVVDARQGKGRTA